METCTNTHSSLRSLPPNNDREIALYCVHCYTAVILKADTHSAVLDRLLDPLTECLTPDVARRIAALRAEPVTQARLDELADKSAEGALSPGEREEYAAYVEAIDLVGLLQAKARAVLMQSETA